MRKTAHTKTDAATTELGVMYKIHYTEKGEPRTLDVLLIMVRTCSGEAAQWRVSNIGQARAAT